MKSDAYYAKLEKVGSDKEPTIDRETLDAQIREFYAKGGKVQECPPMGRDITGRAETNEVGER